MTENSNNNKSYKKPNKNYNKSGRYYSDSELSKIIAKEVAKALAANAQAPQVVNVIPDENVVLTYIGGFAEGTSISLGVMGQIHRPGNELTVPKKVFMQNITAQIETLLSNKYLIVKSGLNEDERIRYGVDYKEGELLTIDQFRNIMNIPKEEILQIFPKLCDSHKWMVEQSYAAAFEKNDTRLDFETVRELNTLSKGIEADGIFKFIVKGMREKLD